MRNAELCPVWLRWVVFVTCVSAVMYGIFRPVPPEMLFDNSDKVGHFLAFAALGITARLALPNRLQWFIWPVLALAAFVLEYLQGVWLPLRTFSLEDSYANLCGVAIGFAVCWVIARYCSK